MVDHCAVVDRCGAAVQSALAVHVVRVALKREPARFCVLPALDAVTPRFVRDVPDAPHDLPALDVVTPRFVHDVPDAPRDLPAQVCDKARTSPGDRPDVVLRLPEYSPERRKELPAVHLVRAIGERLAAELRDWAGQLGQCALEIDLHHDRSEHRDRHRYED